MLSIADAIGSIAPSFGGRLLQPADAAYDETNGRVLLAVQESTNKCVFVLFDPATVADRSTWEDPTALATGIDEVWVNGVPVWVGGKSTGATPGRGIRRP